MNRVARARAAQALRPSKRAEKRYVRDLRGILRAVHEGTVKALAPRARYDAAGDVLDLVSGKLHSYIRAGVGVAFDRMAAAVKKKHNARTPSHTLRGVHPDAALLPAISEARERNIALVEHAARDYAAQVRSVFSDPASWGVRVEDLADELVKRDKIAAILEERASVSESRAELIARDQTLKLNGVLNRVKQTSAGIEDYIWSTSADERVRPDHAALDNTVQTWGSPPVTDTSTGATNEPGQDFQCRCIALPIIPELDDI